MNSYVTIDWNVVVQVIEALNMPKKFLSELSGWTLTERPMVVVSIDTAFEGSERLATHFGTQNLPKMSCFCFI